MVDSSNKHRRVVPPNKIKGGAENEECTRPNENHFERCR